MRARYFPFERAPPGPSPSRDCDCVDTLEVAVVLDPSYDAAISGSKKVLFVAAQPKHEK